MYLHSKHKNNVKISLLFEQLSPNHKIINAILTTGIFEHEKYIFVGSIYYIFSGNLYRIPWQLLN